MTALGYFGPFLILAFLVSGTHASCAMCWALSAKVLPWLWWTWRFHLCLPLAKLMLSLQMIKISKPMNRALRVMKPALAVLEMAVVILDAAFPASSSTSMPLTSAAILPATVAAVFSCLTILFPFISYSFYSYLGSTHNNITSVILFRCFHFPLVGHLI